MAKTFILSDESINSYGFRILTNGILLEQFKKNPVMLFNHRSYGDNYSGPIGRWENIRVEDNKLKADAVFDENDSFAQKIANKVESGFIKGASIGFLTVETSTDKTHLAVGQTRPSVTKSLIYEASIVDLPSNRSALALYDKTGNLIELSAGSESEQLNQILPLINQNSNTMTKLNLSVATLQTLSLQADATEAEIDTAVKKLFDAKKELEDKLQSINKTNAETLVQSVIDAKKIKASDKDKFVQLAMNDYQLAVDTLGAIPTIQLPTTQLHQQNNATADDRSNWTLKDWLQKDNAGLQKLKAENPEAYKQLGVNAMNTIKNS